jgi:hypothetical protein
MHGSLYQIVMLWSLILMEVRYDPSVGVCALGSTLLRLGPVEIWGEISPHFGFWWTQSLNSYLDPWASKVGKPFLMVLRSLTI